MSGYSGFHDGGLYEGPFTVLTCNSGKTLTIQPHFSPDHGLHASIEAADDAANRCAHGYADEGRVCPTCHPSKPHRDVPTLPEWALSIGRADR